MIILNKSLQNEDDFLAKFGMGIVHSYCLIAIFTNQTITCELTKHKQWKHLCFLNYSLIMVLYSLSIFQIS